VEYAQRCDQRDDVRVALGTTNIQVAAPLRVGPVRIALWNGS